LLRVVGTDPTSPPATSCPSSSNLLGKTPESSPPRRGPIGPRCDWRRLVCFVAQGAPAVGDGDPARRPRAYLSRSLDFLLLGLTARWQPVRQPLSWASPMSCGT